MSSPIDFLPTSCDDGQMISNVAVLVYDGVSPFELGVLHEVWGTDRSDEGLPVMDFAVCTPAPGRVESRGGSPLLGEHPPPGAAEAALAAVPASDEPRPIPDAVLETLRAAHARGAIILSVCTGAFVLGE